MKRIHHFVQTQWSERMADRFLTLVFEFEDLVLRYPTSYPISPVHQSLHMATIHRNVKVIYRVDPDRILVVTLLDTRADNTRWY